MSAYRGIPYRTNYNKHNSPTQRRIHCSSMFYRENTRRIPHPGVYEFSPRRRDSRPWSLSDLGLRGLVASFACCSPMRPGRFLPFSPAASSGFRYSALFGRAENCVKSRKLRHVSAKYSNLAHAKLRFCRPASGTEDETRSHRHQKSPGRSRTRQTPWASEISRQVPKPTDFQNCSVSNLTQYN